MERKKYDELMEKISNAAYNISEGLYYSITDDGSHSPILDIKCYSEIKLDKWDIDAIEEIIYSENIDEEKIKEAKKAMEKHKDLFEKLEKMDLLSKTEQAYKLTELVSDCIENEVLEDYGEGDNAIQYIYRTATKWGILYLWYTYIYKNAYKIVYNN